MSYAIIAGILFSGLALSYGIRRRLQTEVERDCLENMYYWTILTLCYAFSSILYVCFHAGELRFSGEYQNGFMIIVGIVGLVLLIEVTSPSGGFGRITGILKRMGKRARKKKKVKKWVIKFDKKLLQTSPANPDFSAASVENTELEEEGETFTNEEYEDNGVKPFGMALPFYVSHKKFKQRLHYKAEDTYNMFYRFTSLVFSGFLIVLPMIRRVTYQVSENNEWVRKHLSDAFLSISGFCLIAMTAICIRQLWYQLRFIRRLPLNKKNYNRMGRSVQANDYMNKKHKML